MMWQKGGKKYFCCKACKQAYEADPMSCRKADINANDEKLQAELLHMQSKLGIRFSDMVYNNDQSDRTLPDDTSTAKRKSNSNRVMGISRWF